MIMLSAGSASDPTAQSLDRVSLSLIFKMINEDCVLCQLQILDDCVKASAELNKVDEIHVKFRILDACVKASAELAKVDQIHREYLRLK